MSDTLNDVSKFISHFKGAEGVFLNGCCYWFAYILKKRFSGSDYMVDIFHDPVEGHFVARFVYDTYPDKINPDAEVRFFDIRGDVTDLYNEDSLENIEVMRNTEERRYGRLMCACRELLEPNEYPAWLQYD